MAKEEPPSTSKDLQELQRKLSLLIESVQNHSKVVAFMKSPVGQYLDRHPFLALTSLVFVAMSTVPVGSFVLLVLLTSLAAFMGVILLEGAISEPISVATRMEYSDHSQSEGKDICHTIIVFYQFYIGKRTFVLRTGHFCGRPLSALRPLWPGFHITRRVRDTHRVLCGGLQPRQLLVFSQTTDTTKH
ncbi:lipid droplet assembly factor 1 isoform X1 [Choloepus didactylus]|uniref:lipid droplet assembly factor 1 isoform X1 n=1 Tax=Choloepus didactylus TaxID=27675 RepID=UPI00189EDD9B|nr:lipid droplet assembly factor 1 isoform X1 [Choloepus didactylus]XP_037671175.1 lipid droplet assembly factor 1 isoform X1 [Choloepus didactylus]